MGIIAGNPVGLMQSSCDLQWALSLLASPKITHIETLKLRLSNVSTPLSVDKSRLIGKFGALVCLGCRSLSGVIDPFRSNRPARFSEDL